MKKPTRQEILLALSDLSELYPDWRLGQMIANLSVAARGANTEAIWDVEDDELLAAINRHLVLRQSGAVAQD